MDLCSFYGGFIEKKPLSLRFTGILSLKRTGLFFKTMTLHIIDPFKKDYLSLRQWDTFSSFLLLIHAVHPVHVSESQKKFIFSCIFRKIRHLEIKKTELVSIAKDSKGCSLVDVQACYWPHVEPHCSAMPSSSCQQHRYPALSKMNFWSFVAQETRKL